MKVFHHTCFAMGTRFNLVIPNMEKERGEDLANKATRILNEQEAIMSSYREDSEVFKINRYARQQKVKLSGELFEILKTCDQYYKKTRGAFDPALLGVTSIIKSTSNSQQSHTDLQSIASGWKHVLLDTNSATIKFTGGKTGLDLGGFGKGWAMEKIITYLMAEDIESAFISFGESTVSVIGEHPLGGPWQTTVPDIHNYNSPLDLDLVNESFSISGLKIKTGENENRKSPHIFNSGEVSIVKEDIRILVKSKSALEAEVLSTALLAGNFEKKNQILNTFDEISVFECGLKGWHKK